MYITENRSIVHHWNQEYCTSLKKGILYNTENRNFVQLRNQEYCTLLKWRGVSMGLVLLLMHQNMMYDGIKSPSFAPSRVGKRWDTVQNKFVEFMCWMIKLLDGDGGVLKRPQYIRLCCNNTTQEATVHQTMLQQHKAHLHSSSYDWCTIFLISVLYKIPVFCVVQYSWFQWCTIFLISVMYNIPLFCDVQYSCFPCSIIVWCMIIWCSLFLEKAWCT